LNSKYKLTTFKSMTVPSGYAEGNMSALDSYDYLQKMGIGVELYQDLALEALKAIPVKRGYVVYSPNKNKEYRAPHMVPTAAGESDWDSFMQNAPSRGWKIEEVVGEEEEPELDDSVSSDEEIPEGFNPSQLKQYMGLDYTYGDVLKVAAYYQQYYDMQRAAYGNDPESLARIDDEEALVTETFNELIDAWAHRVDLLHEVSGGNVEQSLIEELEPLLKEAEGKIVHEPTQEDKKGISFPGQIKAKFKIKFRPGVRDANKPDRKDIHPKALVTALFVASKNGNQEAAKLLEGIRGGWNKDSQASINIAKLFPAFGKNQTEAYDSFYDILDSSKIPTDSREAERKAALAAGIRMAEYMSPPSAATVAEQKKKLKHQELLLRLEKSLILAQNSSGTSAEIKKISSDISKIKAVRDIIDSVETGNFVVQMALELGMTNDSGAEMTRGILDRLDKIFVFRDTNLSFTGIFDSLAPKTGDITPDHMEHIREVLKNKIVESPLILRGGKRQEEFSVKLQNEIFSEITSMFKKDPSKILTTMVLSGSRGTSIPSVGKVFTDYYRDSNAQYGAIFKEHIAPKLASRITALVGNNRTGMSPIDYMNTPEFSDKIRDFMVSDLSVPLDLAESATQRLVERAGIFQGHLNSAFNNSSTSRLSEYAARGFSALVVHAVQSAAGRFNVGMTLSPKIARLFSTVLMDAVDGYNSVTGSFHSASQALFAEALNRARFLPNQDSEDNFVWDASLREAVLANYIRKNGDTGEIIDDMTLVRFMSQDESAVPAHSMLTANIHSRASTIVGDDGLTILDSEEEALEMMRDVQSTNLFDKKSLTETTESLRGASRIMENFSAGEVANAATSRGVLLSESPVENSERYTLSSLATSLKRAYDMDRRGEIGRGEFEKLQNNYRAVVENRIKKLSPEYGEVLSTYVSQNLRLGSVSTIGHALESLSAVPMLLQHLESSSGSDIRESSVSGVVGLSWTGKGGEVYTFGKMDYAQNGTVDYMVIKQSPSGTDIFPGEGKMESSGGNIPHHGNSDNFNKLVTQMWKSNKGKMNIHPTMVLNMPNGSKDHSVAVHELSMNYEVQSIQAPGRTMSHGNLLTADELQRRMTI
jgi:hypothetical protein